MRLLDASARQYWVQLQYLGSCAFAFCVLKEVKSYMFQLMHCYVQDEFIKYTVC